MVLIEKTMKTCSETMILSIKTNENILNSISNVSPLDILTNYANTLNEWFIDIKTMKAWWFISTSMKSVLLWCSEAAILSMQNLWKRTPIHANLVVPGTG